MMSVREIPWHSLGDVLPDYPTRQQAQEIALPWEPVSEPLYRKTIRVEGGTNLDDASLVEDFEQVDTHVLNVRSDNHKTLGVVSNTFVTVSNTEMFDIAEAIESGDPSTVMYETAGSLDGGRKVWVLLRLKDPLVVKGDPRGETIPYYVVQNSHDGSGALRGQSVMTRVVCANTSQVADMEASARGTEIMFRHTKNVRERIEQAQQALAGWREGLAAWSVAMENLIDTTVTRQQSEWFVEQFIQAPPPHLASDRVMTNVEEARGTLRAILGGVTCEGIDHTSYGLVQAATEYAEHYRRSRSSETRFKRAWLDRSKITSDAVTLSRKAALV